MLWSLEDVCATTRELLADLPQRLAHVEGVAGVASSLGASLDVVSAALLHDVGYAEQLHNTGMHAIDGAMFLDRGGAPRDVVSLVAFHTGAEYEADERGLIDRLIEFDRPSQESLDLLILADLVTGPDGRPLEVATRLDEIMSRYQPLHPVHRAVTRSRSYLEACAARAASRTGYPMNGSPPATP